MESQVSALSDSMRHLYSCPSGRFALNIKGLEHKTEWLNYGKLEEQLKALNIGPTRVLPDGSPFYTIPAIHDPSTGITIAESHRILEYLDKTYPETPNISTPPFPLDDDLIKPAFQDMWLLPLTLMLKGIWGLVVPIVVANSDEASGLKYKQRFEAKSGMTFDSVFEESKKRELLEIARANFGEVDAKLEEIRNKYGGEGPWLFGKDVKLPDLAVAGSLAWTVAIVGEDSELWKEIMNWDEGRWAERWERIKPFHKLF